MDNADRTDVSRRRRNRLIVAVTGLIAVVVVLAMTFVTVYNLGFTNGLMAGALLAMVYQVPALVFDWPRITLEHILGFFAALWAAIWGAISSIWS